MYTWIQRLRSSRHRLWFEISERVRWSRGDFVETPAGNLPALPFEQGERIAALAEAYQVQFEATLCAATAVKNYEYLDVLAQLYATTALPRPAGAALHDVGCASFWYAAALQAFFRPASMVGIDVEGHRLFKNGHTRIDYARGYLKAYADARFEVTDYAEFDAPAGVITAWFPFVSPHAMLAWRLPLSLLAPPRLFAQIRRNLRSDGQFIMINHGLEEAEVAWRLGSDAALRRLGHVVAGGPLGAHRLRPAVASVWVAA